MSATEHILHTLRFEQPHAHLISVELEIPTPDPTGQVLQLATWTQGSYLIREYARHLVHIQASCEGQPVALEKQTKNQWKAAPCPGKLTVSYQVYAFDLSVRGCFFNSKRVFIQPSALLFEVVGQDQTPQRLDLCPPPFKAAKKWSVGTALNPKKITHKGFGVYEDLSFEHLIDSPIEIGRLDSIHFTAHGTPHTVWISGAPQDTDFKRLKQDIRAICTTQIAFFGGKAPFKHYTFLLRLEPDAYGGLEHRFSTALLAPQKTMPLKNQVTFDDYVQLLGLISHEYFHAWHVCRIRPAAFARANRTEEAYTRLLWVFEGMTSYYDDLMLLRSRRITADQHLRCLEKTWNQVLKTHGAQVQTLEEASFDAWIKYYRPDENSPNSQVSYYTKGALVAWALDLTLRQQTHHQHSLDTVIQAAWKTFGETNRPIEETEWEAFVQAVTGVELGAFFDHALRSTEPLALLPLLSSAGIEIEPVSIEPPLGIQWKTTDQGLVCRHLVSQGAGEKAGLAVGDQLVALNKQRCSNLAQWEGELNGLKKSEKVTLHLFRANHLIKRILKKENTPLSGVRLSFKASSQ